MTGREPHRRRARPIVMRRVVVVLALLVAPLLWLGAAPAAACSCVTRSVPELVDDADAVAAGRLLRQEAGLQDAVYTFAGSERFKGDLTPGFEVHSAASGAACGLERLVVGRSYVVFLRQEGARFTASLCGGTGRATPAYVGRVESVTGPGTSFDLPPPGSVPAPVVATVRTWSGGLATLLWG